MPSVSRAQCWRLLWPQLAGCPLLVDAHQSALRQYPCPAGTLSSPAGGGRLPSQSPAGAAGAGVPVRSALPIYFLNKSLNTNFYFLNNPYGNIITSTFTALLGEKYYILGFLPATALALFLMYLPWAAD